MATGKTNNGPDVAKLRRLLEAGRDLHDKLGTVLDEFDELLAGGTGIAGKLKTFQGAFASLWGDRYAANKPPDERWRAYLWRHAVDVPNQKRILQALGLEEAIERAKRFIADDDPELARNRHPFAWFVVRINQYAPEGSALLTFEDEAGPADCRHSPRCKTDAACTAKRRAEMRA